MYAKWIYAKWIYIQWICIKIVIVRCSFKTPDEKKNQNNFLREFDYTHDFYNLKGFEIFNSLGIRGLSFLYPKMFVA